jgi:putative hydrolase of HD superfamily
MNPRSLLDALHTAEKLKDTFRHCHTSGGKQESVADHSWRLALMAYWMRDEFPEVDMNKVITMCLIHDLGECFTGDIPTFHKTSADEEREERLLNDWVRTLPAPHRDEMAALYAEISERKTLEARIFKALDGLEAIIQHNEADISTWEDHEYALNLSYADDRVTFSPYLMALREAIREETRKKIGRDNT